MNGSNTHGPTHCFNTDPQLIVGFLCVEIVWGSLIGYTDGGPL